MLLGDIGVAFEQRSEVEGQQSGYPDDGCRVEVHRRADGAGIKASRDTSSPFCLSGTRQALLVGVEISRVKSAESEQDELSIG